MLTRKSIKLLQREESWIYFNERVLQEAADPTVPLIERLKFLGIFSNNLDEFFRVRVAALTRMVQMKKVNNKFIDFEPVELLKKINELDAIYTDRFQDIFQELVLELEKQNIFILNEKKLSKKHGDFVRNYFQEHVRPLLFPLMISNNTLDFPLKDKSIYLAIAMEKKGKLLRDKFALMKIPVGPLSRFLVLPPKGEKKYIILLDDVIRYCLDEIFSVFSYDDIHAYTIKFTRDAELDIDNDISKSFIEIISESLKKRTAGSPVRFIFDRETPEVLLKVILRQLKITSHDTIIPRGRYHNFKDFMGFPNIGSESLQYPVMPPLAHRDLIHKSSIFDVIRKKDIMLHYPYQNFDYIIDLLREASIDPKVRSIRMSLYRLASDSNIINALINAARNGKTVTVFMELQARFDEEANIQYSEKLKEEGVRLIHGIPGFKVHAKLLLIRRKESDQNRYYANISTGNFNEKTARLYSDSSLLTANPLITQDALKIFELFEENFKQQKFKSLVVSPFGMRQFILNHLQTEMKNALNGQEAFAIIKLNNLVDKRIIEQMLACARAGVKLTLIVRSTCAMLPEYAELSRNIEAFSIVDKFLEHSRILVFCNGGDEKYYITSADFMVRNLDNRIEVAVPIWDKEIQKELRSIIDIQMSDNVKSRWLGIDPPNQYRQTSSKKKIRSQIEIYNYFKNLLQSGPQA